MPRNVKNARYVAPMYENRVVKRVPPKTQPKPKYANKNRFNFNNPRNEPHAFRYVPIDKPKFRNREMNSFEKAQVLVSKYERIIEELKAVSVNHDSRLKQVKGHGKTRTPKVKQVWVPKGTI